MIKIINPSTISLIDYPEQENHCLSIYFLGCEFSCKGCSNPILQNWDAEEDIKEFSTIKEFEEYIYVLTNKNKTTKICLMGGDPLYKKNIDYVKLFLERNKNKFDICIYTGYDIDFVKNQNIKGFKYIKCGRYMEYLQQVSYKSDLKIVFASSNQKLYNENFDLLSIDGAFNFT